MSSPTNDTSTLDVLESLMHAAWPASEVESVEGWVLRSAGSVTQRANSIWPRSAPVDSEAALRRAKVWYTERRQPVIFQLTRRPENTGLEELLDRQRYSSQSETLIMMARDVVPEKPSDPEGITLAVSTSPSAQWLDLWWRVDGRGGASERHIAGEIVLGVPSIYASAVNHDGVVVGTARLTVVNGWGGIYCMCVHPEFRRQGIGAALIRRLILAASEEDSTQLWLLVTAANTGAQALYGSAGFTEFSRYHYRQAPLQRAPSAC